MLAPSVLQKLNLKFAYYVFHQRRIDPMLFSHDNSDFSKKRYTSVLSALLDFFSYINALKIYLTIQKQDPEEIILHLYSLIINDEMNPASLCSYEIEDLDLSNMDVKTNDVPERLDLSSFKYVRLFLIFQSGAALNKKAFEYYLDESLTDSQMQTVKKIFEEEICCKIIKRSDNSYYMEAI